MSVKNKNVFSKTDGSGSIVLCSACGAKNKCDDKNCYACGAKLDVHNDKNMETLAFQPVKESNDTNIQHSTTSTNAFAQGLPSWTVEPPQIMIRRR